MNHIVLTEDQVKAVAGTLTPIQVRDSRGNVLGTFAPIWTEEDIAEAKRNLAAGGTGVTTAEMLARLRAGSGK